MTTATENTTKWAIDASHSHVQFKVKHLMITTVTGSINSYNAEIETNGNDFTNASIKFTADATSITTGDAQRDGHLNTADFFEIETHPELTFVSTSMAKKGDDYELLGHLTIKGITHPIALNVEFGGIATDPWGNTKAGFIINGKISRKEWGLNWNAALETGGFLVSDEVKVVCEIQLAKQA